MAAQVGVADELALPAATAPGAVLGGDRVISGLWRDLGDGLIRRRPGRQWW
jgi:hypothetical protein